MPADLLFGLGTRAQADAVRVLWPSGILQTETPPAGSARIALAELDRKPSSCPFLYTWNGDTFTFVTDFMGGGEMGYLESPGVYNVADPIPLHISALGPRGRRLTAELNAGWIYATGNVTLARAAIADMQSAWREAGVDPARRVATAFTGGCVLSEGEAYDSPRVKAQTGPHATIALHNLVEIKEYGDMGRPLPHELAPLLERYRQIYEKYEPADARYLSNHRGHLMFLRAEEQEICTAELIRMLTFTASRAELQSRIRELGASGYNHFAINIRHGHPEMLEEWADVFSGV